MTNVQNLDDLLDQLDASREKLLVAIEPLPDEALVEPGAVGDWSVAALLAILTAWEAELVTGLMKIDQGKRPDNLLKALAASDAFTLAAYQESEERLLDQVFDDWQRVRVQLEGWLESFSERDLTRPGRYNWSQGKSLAEIVLAATAVLESTYTPDVAAFSAQWQETAVSPTSNSHIIPLTTLFPEVDDDNHHNPD